MQNPVRHNSLFMHNPTTQVHTYKCSFFFATIKKIRHVDAFSSLFSFVYLPTQTNLHTWKRGDRCTREYLTVVSRDAVWYLLKNTHLCLKNKYVNRFGDHGTDRTIHSVYVCVGFRKACINAPVARVLSNLVSRWWSGVADE